MSASGPSCPLVFNTYTIRLLKCIQNIVGFLGQDVLRKKLNNRMFD